MSPRTNCVSEKTSFTPGDLQVRFTGARSPAWSSSGTRVMRFPFNTATQLSTTGSSVVPGAINTPGRYSLSGNATPNPANVKLANPPWLKKPGDNNKVSAFVVAPPTWIDGAVMARDPPLLFPP